MQTKIKYPFFAYKIGKNVTDKSILKKFLCAKRCCTRIFPEILLIIGKSWNQPK